VSRTVLVTGGTDGIGLALVRRLAARGDRPIVVGRREPREISGLLPRKAPYFRTDLSEPDAAQRIADALDAAHVPSLDALVHNAAVGRWGHPTEDTGDGIRTALAVNLRAPILLTRLLLPRLVTARGAVLFVGSVADAVPCPDFAVYAATKAAIAGFARSLRVEMGGQVRVQVVRPGATRTGMHRKSGVPDALVDGRRWPSADRVAARILRVLDRGTRERTLGVGNRLARFVGLRLTGPLDLVLRGRRR
jgi:short-subunit dehydrogenase